MLLVVSELGARMLECPADRNFSVRTGTTQYLLLLQRIHFNFVHQITDKPICYEATAKEIWKFTFSRIVFIATDLTKTM